MGKFRMDNGNDLDVVDDGAVQWSPDSCECILIYDAAGTSLIHARRRCAIHKAQPLNALLTVVLAHNRALNNKFGNSELTQEQIDEMANDKANERARVKAIGPPDKYDENGQIIPEAGP
jgi:hypothetical protein